MVPSRTELLARARWMRANPTEAECKLWTILRDRRLIGIKFKRQHIIAPFVVDFACLSGQLIVEADGSQHADNRRDDRRDAYLRSKGFRVLRFWNNDVLTRCDAVAEAIFGAIARPHPPTALRRAPPSPVPGEGQGVLNG